MRSGDIRHLLIAGGAIDVILDDARSQVDRVLY